MARPVTEIVTSQLKASVNLEDQSSAGYRILQDTLQTISEQDGAQHVYAGSTIEDASKLQIGVDWTSMNAHEKFAATPGYNAFVERFMTISEGPPLLWHFYPADSPPSVLISSPVVEMATFYQTDDTFLSNARCFLSNITAADGYTGAECGPIVEKLERSAGSGNGEAVAVCIGWESVSAHLLFRETDIFRDNIHLLRTGTTGVEMHHTVFRLYQ